MIYIFKMTSGEDVMGKIETNLLPEDEYYNIIDPMTVIGMRDETTAGLRLRDTLLLGVDNVLTVHVEHVLSYYQPSPQLAEYYEVASKYAKKYTRPAIQEQIIYATKEMEQEYDEQNIDQLGEMLRKFSGSSIH